jgi:hypothetical protein
MSSNGTAPVVSVGRVLLVVDTADHSRQRRTVSNR